jgi:hypothetical protein
MIEDWSKPIESIEAAFTDARVLEVYEDGTAAVAYKWNGKRHASVFDQKNYYLRNVPHEPLEGFVCSADIYSNTLLAYWAGQKRYGKLAPKALKEMRVVHVREVLP